MSLHFTSGTGSAVEGTLGVVAGNYGVGGARLDGQVTFIDISHAGRVPSRSLPAALTDALVFRLFIGENKIISTVKFNHGN